MGDWEDRLVAAHEENRRLKRALRMRGRRRSGRKIRRGTHKGDGRVFGYALAYNGQPEHPVSVQQRLIRQEASRLGQWGATVQAVMRHTTQRRRTTQKQGRMGSG